MISVEGYNDSEFNDDMMESLSVSQSMMEMVTVEGIDIRNVMYISAHFF